MKNILTFICLLFLMFSDAQNSFPNDLVPMGLKGKVKKMRQKSINKGAKPYLLDETFFFDKDGYLEKIEHHTLPQVNIERKSLGRLTIFSFINDDSRLGVTFGETDNDTIKVQRIRLLNDKTIKIQEKQIWNKDYESEIIHKLDSSNKLVESETTVFKGKSKNILFNYSCKFIYKNSLIKEIITKSNGVINKTQIDNEKLDDYENFTFRNHISESGTIMFTEEREIEYY
ncbi:hypothetical protein [uncultured Winogradskyella sp.]|uniref:hypothetical protein n=1 Tax=uncultured Winogradskyella sp. TaxID=395353 RepID=UPI002613D5FD|nr:hypothetical protein [uncultured Winogradskyella sp.]